MYKEQKRSHHSIHPERPKRFEFTVTEDEYLIIKNRYSQASMKGKMTMTDFIRRTVLGSTVHAPIPKEIREHICTLPAIYNELKELMSMAQKESLFTIQIDCKKTLNSIEKNIENLQELLDK